MVTYNFRCHPERLLSGTNKHFGRGLLKDDNVHEFQTASIVENEDSSVTISANVPEFDTTDIENRLDVVEGKASKNAEDIISLQEALKNVTPEGEALSGDGITIKTNEDGFLTVRLSEQELNVLKKNSDGLYVQGVEMVLGDDEINAEEE